MKSVVLSIRSILGADIRTRSRISEVISRMDTAHDYVIDLSGVEFISRSFADELLSFVDHSPKHPAIVNASREISEMLEIVRLGRNSKFSASNNSEVKNLNSMMEVELFFNSL